MWMQCRGNNSSAHYFLFNRDIDLPAETACGRYTLSRNDIEKSNNKHCGDCERIHVQLGNLAMKKIGLNGGMTDKDRELEEDISRFRARFR